MWQLLTLCLVASASAQIPALGWCPDYQPMADFNMNRFLGDWYESERYFTVSELGTRCVRTTYDRTPEGRILVSNEITNSLTGVKRLLEGSLQLIGREGEGKVIVKYSSLPVPYDTEYSILDTDYENFAVMWACSGIGPVHTQNAWVLTRQRIAPSAVLQAAYGVLDKYKISRTFFVKTNQADCSILPSPIDKNYGKNSGNVQVAGKHASLVQDAGVPKVAEPDEKEQVQAKPDVEVAQERVAVASPAKEPNKEQYPALDLMMAEAGAKKEEKIEKPAEEPIKSDIKVDLPEPINLKEKEQPMH